MPNASRVGDINNAFGKIMPSGVPTVFISGKPAGVLMNKVTPHLPFGKPHPPHKAARVITGSSKVLCNGKPLLKVGSRCTCGHKIVQGSLTVYIP